MNTGKIPISDDELNVKLRLARCGCVDHEPIAFRYILFADERLVYLASQCGRCRRLRLLYLSDIDVFQLSGNPLDGIYETLARHHYAQTPLF